MLKPRDTFALNFSDQSIEAIELSRAGDRYVVKTHGRLLLESGIIEDGKIIEKEKLRSAVRALIQQAKPLPIQAREVALTIPESKVFAQTISLPQGTDKRQVPAALHSQAKESVPIDTSIMVADYRPLGSREGFDDYLFVATYQQLIDEYVAFFSSLQLKVGFITMESLALAGAVIPSGTDETVLLLDIGARTTIASIFKGLSLHETININIAGNNITAALAERLKISPAEAEQRKITHGMTAQGDASDMLIIQGQIQPLKDELLVFIKYYEERSGDKIDRVLVGGGSAALAGLVDYFGSNLGLPTATAAPLPAFQVQMQQAYLPKYLVVLGLARLAFEAAVSINFLRKHDRGLEKKFLKGGELGASAASKTMLGTLWSKLHSRTFMLTILLAAALVAFAGVFAWKRFSARPAAVADLPSAADLPTPRSANKVLSFIFTVATNKDSAQAGDLLGRLDDIELRETYTVDSDVRDQAVQNFRQRLGSDPSAEQIDAELQGLLANRLWMEKKEQLRSAAAPAGGYMLDWYISREIRKAQQTGAGGIIRLELVVSFRSIVLTDAAAFTKLENDTVTAFESANPGLVLQGKAYRYGEIFDDGRVQVVAEYNF